MKVIELTQGSPEWHEYRRTARNASDAPAMLGISPYKTREELLREKATGIVPEPTPQQQRIFDRGHLIESLARSVAEDVIGEALSPCVGTDGTYSASFDGITFDGETAWECKSLNNSLRQALPLQFNGIHNDGLLIPEHYRAQLEQQIIVSGCKLILFTAASLNDDGDLDEVTHCWYASDPVMRARLVAGWKQFDSDLAAWKPTEQAAPVVIEAVDSLPAVYVQVQGVLTVAGNLDTVGDALRAFIDRIPARPETDEEFGFAEQACKELKKAEDALAQAEKSALAQITDVEQMQRTVADLKNLARNTRLATEKLVKVEKDNRRAALVFQAKADFRAHVEKLQLDVKGVRLIVGEPDFAGAIKGQSSVERMKQNLAATLLEGQAAANSVAGRVSNNIQMLESVKEYGFLFSDKQELVYKEAETLEMLIEKRVADHKAAEAAKLEAERERIRAEEERKAKEAAEREAEAERQRIREEEQAKAQAEAADRMKAEQAEAVKLLDQQINATEVTGNCDTGEGMATHLPDTGSNPVLSAPKHKAQGETPTLKLTDINARLAPLSVSAAVLSHFGIDALAKEKNAHRFSEAQFAQLVAALRNHLDSVFCPCGKETT